MLDYASQRKLIVIFIMATVITIIVAIVALVIIWIPEKEKEEKFEIGKVAVENVQQETVLQKYAKEIIQIITNKDSEKIYNITGKDYIEQKKLNKESLIAFLESKGVWGKSLDLGSYGEYTISGYKNVYAINLVDKGGVYSINVVIREVSPQNYTIAYDNFIDYKKNVVDGTMNSIRLKLCERTRYTNTVEYTVEISNNFDKKAIINYGAIAYPIILVNSSGKVKNPAITTLATSEVTLVPGSSRRYQAVFAMTNATDYLHYNTLVLKNVSYEGIVGIQNLEYKLY